MATVKEGGSALREKKQRKELPLPPRWNHGASAIPLAAFAASSPQPHVLGAFPPLEWRLQ